MSRFIQNLPLFPTTVIGSLPRPAWLLDLMQEFLAGRVARRMGSCLRSGGPLRDRPARSGRHRRSSRRRMAA